MEEAARALDQGAHGVAVDRDVTQVAATALDSLGKVGEGDRLVVMLEAFAGDLAELLAEAAAVVAPEVGSGVGDGLPARRPATAGRAAFGPRFLALALDVDRRGARTRVLGGAQGDLETDEGAAGTVGEGKALEPQRVLGERTCDGRRLQVGDAQALGDDGEPEAVASSLEPLADLLAESRGIGGGAGEEHAAATGGVERAADPRDVEQLAGALIELVEGRRGAGGDLDALGVENPWVDGVGVEADQGANVAVAVVGGRVFGETVSVDDRFGGATALRLLEPAAREGGGEAGDQLVAQLRQLGETGCQSPVLHVSLVSFFVGSTSPSRPVLGVSGLFGSSSSSSSSARQGASSLGSALDIASAPFKPSAATAQRPSSLLSTTPSWVKLLDDSSANRPTARKTPEVGGCLPSEIASG